VYVHAVQMSLVSGKQILCDAGQITSYDSEELYLPYILLITLSLQLFYKRASVRSR
jgi:hypothetical protein